MVRTMNKDEVIAVLRGLQDWLYFSAMNGGTKIQREAIDVAIEAIRSEPHWIPVTERPPETTDAVLTTYIVNGDRSRRYVEESSYYWSDESWCSPWDEYRDVGTSIDVIAWMPMPAPWEGE